MNVQKIATRVFVGASLFFGVIGILMVLTAPESDNESSTFNMVVMKLFFISIFIILPSFALSVASKYLNGKS
jgi:hypothetical protein